MVYGWSQTRVEKRNSWQLETETLDRIFLLCFLSCRVSLLGLSMLEFLLGCCPTAMSLQINLCANLPIFNQALKCCTSHRFHRYILKLSSQVLYVFMTVSRSLPWTWGLNESSLCISCNIEPCRENSSCSILQPWAWRKKVTYAKDRLGEHPSEKSIWRSDPCPQWKTWV